MDDTTKVAETANGKQKPFESEASFDHVRKLVKKEGIEAKNLVSWHVPLNEALCVDTGQNGDELKSPENHLNDDQATPKPGDETSKSGGPSSSTMTRMKGGGKRSDFRSRHWTYLFDNLRRTVDAIYDTCYFDQSVIECKEAIMILENCTKDFQALIDYFNNQAVWEKCEKPTAMAWEVRKTAGSPNKHFPPQIVKHDPAGSNCPVILSPLLETKEKADQVPNSDGLPNGNSMVKRMIQSRPGRRPRPTRLVQNACSFEPVILPAVKKNVEAKESVVEAVATRDDVEKKAKSEEEKKTESNPSDALPLPLENGHDSGDGKANDDEGWEVVSYARGRRNSMEDKFDKRLSANQLQFDSESQKRQLLVQQQGKPSRTSIFPRNAQEIRQTKASLGKMVHNRQYLAGQRQKELEDKMKLFDSPSGRRRMFGTSGVSISLPSLTNRIGINFADPDAVKRSAQALKAALMKGGGRSRRFRSYQSMESVQSLESIKEEDGGCGVEKESIINMIQNFEVASKESQTNGLIEDPHPEKPISNNDGSMEQGAPLEKADDSVVNANGEADSSKLDLEFEKSKADTEANDFTPVENFGDPDSDETWKHLTEEEESLAQEEESIQKEMEEERKSIDIEMSRQIDDDDVDEGDSNEARDAEDGAALASESQLTPSVDSKPMSWQELVARWESNPVARSTLCWGDLVEMELAEVRSPGQAVHVHEKLSSPSRQKNLTEGIKKREERRNKAYEMRQQILEQRHQRMRELSKRVEEVQEARRYLVEKKKAIMEERLAKAEENRNLLLLARIKKAHDEDEKVNEIAFINTLEAGNKRHDVLSRQQDLESRLQTIHDERQRRSEGKAAREAAAEERRKAADERRQMKLLERAERTKRRQEQIELQRSEQERERQQLAKEKAREREERLAEMKAAKQANTEELIQRIQQKQEESMRRHEENLEQIKLRASEMSTPRSLGPSGHGFDVSAVVLEMLRPPSCQPYVKQKLCTVCNILIPTDVHLLAHLKGKRHAASLKEALPGKVLTKELTDQESQKCIVDASDEKVQALSPSPAAISDRAKMNRKRRQRLRQKLQTKVKEYDASNAKSQNSTWQSSQQLQKMTKAFKDIGRCLETCGLDKQWLSADIHTLERAVGELTRIMSQQVSEKEQEAFHGLKIQDLALLLLSVLEKQNACDVTRLPLRSVMNVCNMLKTSLTGSEATVIDMVYSNRIGSCIDALAFQLQFLNQEKANGKHSMPVNQKSVPQECVVVQLVSLIIVQLEEIVNAWKNGNFGRCFDGEIGFRSRVSLVLSYMVACGVVDQFGAYFSTIVDLPMDGVQYDVVLHGFRLMAIMLKALLFSHGSVRSINEDATQLLEAIRCTELCNLLPILYSVLLSPNTMSLAVDRQTPPKMADSTVTLVTAALDLVNCVGASSWQLLQDILGQEGSSLEFRHVASFLISYGNRYDCQSVLHRIIASVGYFTILNSENQALVHFGSQPSILQQLCVLPFGYFSDKKLTKILYPTMIACAYQNEANRFLLEQELSCTLLSDFLKQRLHSDNEKGVSGTVEDALYSIEWRFPKTEWKNAIEYFDSPLSA